MTDNATTTQATETTEEEAVEAVVVPQPVHWVNGLTPLFVLEGVEEKDMDDTIDIIRDSGYGIFYVLGEQKTPVYTTNATTKTQTISGHVLKPRLFKVVSNLVGKAISVVDQTSMDKSMKLGQVNTAAWFELPRIPIDLINKIDTFFRHIDDKFNTEAVVIFTYDPTFKDSENPGDGWGILVPEQENTAAACNYDSTTVVDDKDDHVFIVGTAHSHPGMDAFCSGTDKKDQATLDGIHITFGWKWGPTEHHIELQMGGGAFSLEPKDTFEGYVTPEPDEEIKTWSERVKKKGAPAGRWQGGSNVGSIPAKTGGTQSYGSYYTTKAATMKGVPVGAPFEGEEVQLIVQKGEFEVKADGKYTSCPACYKQILDKDRLETMRCTRCSTFIIGPNMTVDDLLETRRKHGFPVVDIIEDGDSKPRKDVVFWRRFKEGNKPEVKHEYKVLYTFDNKAKKVDPPAPKSADAGEKKS